MIPGVKQKLTLPNGTSLNNRIVKAATEELLANREGEVTQDLVNLYDVWSRSGAGMIITGNMFISREAMSRFGNVVLRDEATFKPRLAKLASAIKQHGSKAIVQLNHAGRQALRNAKTEVVAPSAVPLKGFGPIFVTPRALEEAEIETIISQFVQAARICWEAGFDGVEVHAAHGYLLSQFLSPLTNHRDDRWGGSLEGRARAFLTILEAIRRDLPRELILGVKINSADFQRGGFEEGDALELIRLLQGKGLDFIEISGGSYEAPAMAGRASGVSTRKREAYFLDFAQKARPLSTVPLMVTGGFRTAAGMNQAVADDAVDLIGLARPMLLEPDFPQRVLHDDKAVACTPHDRLGIKKLDDMLQTFWYKRQMTAIARRGRSLGPRASRWAAILCELPKAIF
jgi:2,4-dienoyl-CoA reductase-like NADH-dependent reductase (Old Yellow Enzyme family)